MAKKIEEKKRTGTVASKKPKKAAPKKLAPPKTPKMTPGQQSAYVKRMERRLVEDRQKGPGSSSALFNLLAHAGKMADV